MTTCDEARSVLQHQIKLLNKLLALHKRKEPWNDDAICHLLNFHGGISTSVLLLRFMNCVMMSRFRELHETFMCSD